MISKKGAIGILTLVVLVAVIAGCISSSSVRKDSNTREVITPSGVITENVSTSSIVAQAETTTTSIYRVRRVVVYLVEADTDTTAIEKAQNTSALETTDDIESDTWEVIE